MPAPAAPEQGARDLLELPAMFDSHLHIIDPRFPLVPNQGWVPEPFTVDDYRSATEALPVRLVGGVVVSGSFQGSDQTYLIDALARLGPGFVGVTQLPRTVTDEELQRLDEAGVRGLRFNLRRGGSEGRSQLEAMASRVHDTVGWHTELYLDAGEVAALESIIRRLPSVSIDHLGLMTSTESAEFRSLLRLVESGVKVKATGFGRVRADVVTVMRQICDTDPTALMFGTDLPSTRAPRPFTADDVMLALQAVGDRLAPQVLAGNAIAHYGLRAR